MGLKRNKNGFTLIELIVVIAIVGVLATVLVPAYISYIEKSRAAADSYTLGELNEATRVYYAADPSPNPFEISGTTDAALMQTLVGEDFFSEPPVPKQADVSFTWSYSSEVWLLSTVSEELAHVVTASEITFKSNYWKNVVEAYSGTAANIVIPKTLNVDSKVKTIEEIYQAAFTDKNLTSVTFAADSTVSRIHKWAFKNNALTEISLPSTVSQIDYEAFIGNNITKVTIGANVTLESNVFLGNNLFKSTYDAGGKSAGTYIYTGGLWVKQ